MLRIVSPVERVDLGNGMFFETGNETWEEPLRYQRQGRPEYHWLR